MAKKICMLVAHHPFLDARIFKKEAKSLQKKGYKVTMIVPSKNGRLFDIDGKPFKKQFIRKVFKHEGIKIVSYDYVSSRNALNTVLSNEKVWESRGFTNPLTQLAIKEDADIYHAHEYLSLFAGVGIKRLMKKQGKDIKLIYDSHELTPDPFLPKYSAVAREQLQNSLFIMLKEVDYIITVSNSIKSWYLSHMPQLPIEVIYNSPPLSKVYQPKNYDSRTLTVGYEGNIVANKGNQKKIFGISEICSQKMDFRFKIIGGARYGQTITVPKHLDSVIKQVGWVDYFAIPKHMKDIDIGWIDFEGVEQSLNQEYALPNKFFSFLNNGIPVVVNKCHEMETFIRKHKCGYVINKKQATAKDFAEAFLYLHKNKDQLRQMSRNGRNVMEKLYAWEIMEKKLFRVYDELLKNQ